MSLITDAMTARDRARFNRDRRTHYVLKFDLTERQRKALHTRELDQLDFCKSDAARRLILGIRE